MLQLIDLSKRLLIFVSVFAWQHVTAQTNFDHYHTIKASGPIPSDFTKLTQTKIANDIANSRGKKARKKKEEYYNGIKYQVEVLLHSGNLIYGDEVSLYVEKVAANLLKDEPALFAQLRFYTYKSNDINLFISEDGIIITTTGLLAQINSEAQLAFLLAHEIAHFTEKHQVSVLNLNVTNNNHNFSISNFTSYSDEDEKEADEIGLKRIYKSRYSKSTISETFELLIYSYLPFEEVAIPDDFFNTSKLVVPPTVFSNDLYPISSFNNVKNPKIILKDIKKRKEYMDVFITDFTSWGNANFQLNEKEFNEIRTIARFENVRNSIIQNDFYGALYSIYVLQKNYPNSTYLNQMKALTWLSIAQFHHVDREKDIVFHKKSLEGESARLLETMYQLSKNTKTIIALRIIYDLKNEHPTNEFYKACYQHILKVIATDKKFNRSNYLANAPAKEVVSDKKKDSTLTENGASSNSKYQKIKTKKTQQSDTSSFHFYLIADIAKDPSFIASYNTLVQQVKQNDTIPVKKKNHRNKLSQRLDAIPKLEITTATNLLLMEPSVFENNEQSIDQNKIKAINETMIKQAERNMITWQILSSESIANKGTEEFNKKNLLNTLISQHYNYDSINFVPIDFEDLQLLKTDIKTSNVLFTYIDYNYTFEDRWRDIILYNLFIPVIPISLFIYLPKEIQKNRIVTCRSILIDLSSGTIKKVGFEELNGKIKNPIIGSYFYNLFNDLNN